MYFSTDSNTFCLGHHACPQVTNDAIQPTTSNANWMYELVEKASLDKLPNVNTSSKPSGQIQMNWSR